MTETIPCPVCGKTHVAEYDICDVCGWENGPVQLFEPNLPGGANEMSLQQARMSYHLIRNRTSMRTGDMIKVRFIEKDDPITLRNGKIYVARVLKPTKKGKRWYGIEWSEIK
ncbi:MAG TPA: hypothetical protein DCL93_01780 [Faecalibacterium sp.]|nr:hypothetical protein [Faecalibacterium sp.]